MKKLFIVALMVLSLVAIGAGNVFACEDGQCGNGGAIVGAVSLSATGSIVGDLGNGALAGSGAGALAFGGSYLGDKKLKAVAYTESFSFTAREKGYRWNTDFGGMEKYHESYAYTDSFAKANVKKPRRCSFEFNAVGVIGVSGVTSSIGDPSHGAGGLAGGAYLAGGISHDKIIASGFSESYSTSWKGQTANAQWSGAYATNTSVASINMKVSQNHTEED